MVKGLVSDVELAAARKEHRRGGGSGDLFQNVERLRSRSDSTAPVPTPAQEEAGAHLRSMLIKLFVTGNLTATMLIDLSVAITKAGGCGLDDLAKELKHPKNAYRVVSKVIGAKEIQRDILQYFKVPQRRARGQRAQLRTMPMLPFHEVFALQFKNRSADFMQHVANPDLLMPNFYSHETVLQHGAQSCFPLRLFVDYAVLDKQVSTLNIHMLPLASEAPFSLSISPSISLSISVSISLSISLSNPLSLDLTISSSISLSISLS